MNNPDRYGYYVCGPMKTYRKWEAIAEHQRTGIHPTWYFNDDVWGACDWRIEPESDLRDLYRLRAQQLRENYDYLVLWYSGGADSNTALEAFVENNIHLDEVVSWTNYSATGDRFDFCNGEIFNVAVPKIKKIQQDQPWLKLRILDICDSLVAFFQDAKTGTEWIYDTNVVSAAINAARPRLISQVREWQELAHQGKRIALITGTDKPRIYQHDDGRWSFRFIDIFDNSVTPAQQIANSEVYTPEFFFWSPDLPQIIIKQSHVVKKWLRNANFDHPSFTTQVTGLANKNFNGKSYWLTPAGLHELIYPGWEPIPYQVKNPSPLFSQRESWFRKMTDLDLAYHNYRISIEKKWQITPDYWKRDPANPSRGFKHSFSRDYDIGF